VISGIESANLKLLRAAIHLNAIREKVAACTDSDSYEIVPEPNSDGIFKVLRDPDPGIAVLAGEMLYHLRSALDHLAFDLVKVNAGSIQLPSDWEEECAFPLCLDPLKSAPKYNCFSRKLPGISKIAFTFIESVQPYNRGNGNEIAAHLGWLAKLRNIDEHRHLNLIFTRGAKLEAIMGENGNTTFVRSTLENEAKITSEISEVPDAMKVQRRVIPFIAFGESIGRAANLPIQYILERCLNAVETGIVPAFKKFIQDS
jgi:hypothetical protein